MGPRVIAQRFLGVVPALFLLLACSGSLKQAGHTQGPPSPAEQKGEKAQPDETPLSTKPHKARSSSSLADGSKASPLRQLFAEVPAGGRLIGGSGGIALEALGASGHWVAYCQRATKDGSSHKMPTSIRGTALKKLRLHIQVGSKARAIEALLAYDDTGRYFITLEQGAAWLTDALRNERWALSPLDPDLRFDSLSDHRSFAFAGGGLVVLSASKKNTGHFIPLAPGAKAPRPALLKHARAISFGKRPVWRLRGDDGSVSASTTSEDSSPKAWPVPLRSKATPRCRSPLAAFSAYSRASAYRPDPSIENVWLKLPSQKQQAAATRAKSKRTMQAQPAPGFVMSLGDAWVRRLDTGRLLLVQHGVQKQIASQSCGARILHLDRRSGLFLVACEEYTPVRPKKRKTGKPKYRFGLNLVRPGFVRNLRVDVARTGVDVEGAHPAALFPIRPGAGAALVDFKKRSLVALEKGVHVLSTSNSHALLRRGKKYSLWSARGQESVDLQALSLAPTVSAGPAVAVGAKVLLLGKALQSWDLPAPPLALSPQGYALIPQRSASAQAWPEGPFLLLGPPEEAKAR